MLSSDAIRHFPEGTHAANSTLRAHGPYVRATAVCRWKSFHTALTQAQPKNFAFLPAQVAGGPQSLLEVSPSLVGSTKGAHHLPLVHEVRPDWSRLVILLRCPWFCAQVHTADRLSTTEWSTSGLWALVAARLAACDLLVPRGLPLSLSSWAGESCILPVLCPVGTLELVRYAKSASTRPQTEAAQLRKCCASFQLGSPDSIAHR